MEVEVFYTDGSSRQWKTTYISYEQSGAVVEVDELDFGYLENYGVYLVRRYVNKKGEFVSPFIKDIEGIDVGTIKLRDDHTRATGILIAKIDEYEDIVRITKDGVDVLIGDGHGKLLLPQEIASEPEAPKTKAINNVDIDEYVDEENYC